MNIENILATEFSERFVALMKNAMTVSFYKYGALKDAYPLKVNAVASLMERLKKYEETGNTEYMIDVANFAMIEFMLHRHPSAFYQGTDDDGSPGRVVSGGKIDKRGNDEIGINPNSLTAKFR